jgi:hypothetical protein
VTPRLRHAATQLLAHEAGEERVTSEQLAAASARLLDRLLAGLGQVLGHAGARAVFLRALKIQRAESPFLGGVGDFGRKDDDLSEQLRACLQSRDPETIKDVSEALFATAAGLLVALIGETLAWRLLQGVSPGTFLSAPETAGE